MRNITIGFSKPKNRIFPIASWLIRLYQQTPYSHVYLQFDSETVNRSLIYEAVGHGVRFVGNIEWGKSAEMVKEYKLEIKECNFITIIQYCVDHAGLEYGFWQNVGIFLAELFKLKKNPFKTGKNCSEVIAEILKVEGYQLQKELNLITPKDIDIILSS